MIDLLKLRAAADAALHTAAEDLLGRAQRDAPVEEGTLRASGHIDYRTTGLGSEAEVSFNTVYAARQHEETGWQHPHGGKAKYLEDNLKAMTPTYRDLLAAAIRKAL